MNINELKAAISDGVLRTYRWRVTFSFPDGTEEPDAASLANVLAKTTTLPPSTLGEIEILWGGRTVPIPGDREFAEWPITFLATQDFKTWKSFMKWSNFLNGHQSNQPVTENYVDQTKDVTFEMLDAEDNVLVAYTLNSAWPKEVGEISLDRGSQNEAGEFIVTMRFIDFSIAGISS